MERNKITIPKEYTYLSEVKHYMLNGEVVNKPLELFKGIFNKVVTGCGGTTLVLKDNIPTVVCCPRKGMLVSKHLQLMEDGNFTSLLVIGNDLIIDDQVVYRKQEKKDILNYIQNYKGVPKILVTYDSLYKVIPLIKDIERWHIVVDEFQLCLFDSGMKSEIEQRMFDLVRNLNTTFLSATPLSERALEFIDEIFKDIPYYECEFEDRIEKIEIQRIECKKNSPIKAMEQIMKDWYLKGNYYTLNGVQSKECVIFLNSVSNIVKIIKEMKLVAEQVNIICSDNEENLKYIRANLDDSFNIGYVPTDTNNKMFTLCTSTAYCGIDFYSDNAAIFIISDTTKANTTLDIEFELQQIIGRERLEINPFRYYPFLLYNTRKKRSKEFIDNYISDIERRTKITEVELERLNSIKDRDMREYEIRKIKQLQRATNYEVSYTSYNSESDKFIFNKCYKLNELYKLQQLKLSYDGIMVYNRINATNTMQTQKETINIEITKDIIQCIERLTNTKDSFEQFMKRYCEYRDNNFYDLAIDEILQKYPQIKDYYELLGSKKIKALSYKESNLKNEIVNNINNGNKDKNIIYEISKHLNTLYSSSEIKNIMQNLYIKYDIRNKDKIKTAKAKDVEIYGYNIIKKNIRVDGKQITKYIIQ